MSVMPTSDRHDIAGKLVEHAKLHSLDRFPEWAGIILGTPKIDEKVLQNENHGFRAIFALDDCDAHLRSPRHR